MTLAGFSISGGALTPLTGSPFPLGYAPIAAVVNPANTILFVSSNLAIYAYSINSSTGALNVLNSGNPVGGAVTGNKMAISPDGNWLIALSSNGAGALLNEFQINSSSTTAVLTGPILSSVAATGVTPMAVTFSPNGDYLYAALGTAGDVVYSFNTSTSGTTAGALTNFGFTGTLTAPLSDNALAVGPNDSIVYVARANSTSAGAIIEYSVGSNANGLTLNDAASTPADVQPFAMVVNKAGTDLYAANQSKNSISGYSIASGTIAGTLTALSTSPYTSQVGSEPTSLAVDNSGKYLLAMSLDGGPYLTMFSYDSTTAGQLDSLTTTSTGITSPMAMATTH
jgi:6-phosphogluconolactonase (cycloisomerase 2 family)